jgi:hypothetical protein
MHTCTRTTHNVYHRRDIDCMRNHGRVVIVSLITPTQQPTIMRAVSLAITPYTATRQVPACVVKLRWLLPHRRPVRRTHHCKTHCTLHTHRHTVYNIHCYAQRTSSTEPSDLLYARVYTSSQHTHTHITAHPRTQVRPFLRCARLCKRRLRSVSRTVRRQCECTAFILGVCSTDSDRSVCNTASHTHSDHTPHNTHTPPTRTSCLLLNSAIRDFTSAASSRDSTPARTVSIGTRCCSVRDVLACLPVMRVCRSAHITRATKHAPVRRERTRRTASAIACAHVKSSYHTQRPPSPYFSLGERVPKQLGVR